MLRRAASIVLALALLVPAGCSRADEPVRASREALGTVVTIEAWGENPGAVEAALEDAFAAIADVEHELDAYSATSTIAAVNAAPFEPHVLPASALAVLDAIGELGVAREFSPYLLGVVKLYGFGGAKHVPTYGELSAALMTASMPQRDGDRFSFAPISSSTAVPGLDFGGAAKGLALDRARDALHDNIAITAAIISAGSTTVTLGDKPDGEPWRVGIEDAREPGVAIAVAEWDGEAALSTSGDYQQYFESGGVRYHHILDPATGEPARTMRTLTVVGRISGLESDILSTALFVRGPEGALAYARERSLAVHLTDSEGRTHLAPAPADSGITLTGE
ncbi:MAG: FAD:protein FMN transferase [Coriobacteriia bacterium]